VPVNPPNQMMIPSPNPGIPAIAQRQQRYPTVSNSIQPSVTQNPSMRKSSGGINDGNIYIFYFL